MVLCLHQHNIGYTADGMHVIKGLMMNYDKTVCKF